MKITKIPYPRPALKFYVLMALMIGFTVGFILIAFQPFGTANFKHPYKNWILAGYGITVFLSLVIIFTLSKMVVHKKGESNWNILYEVIVLFFSLIISLVACYIYSLEIFGGTYQLKQMLYFISLAGSVAILPVLGSLGYLYFSWKDVVRSSLEISETENKNEKLTLLINANKSDQLKINANEIILAQAQSNYVMLFFKKDEQIKRHIIRSTLKQIKEQLDDKIFIQAHRSFIINKNKIKNLSGNKSKASIELEGYQKSIPISRNIYDSLKSIAN